jgi:sigma-B regulation protein RsbU (phosphoserine phosphatase)
VNRELCRRTHDGRFVTIFWAEYDPITGMLRYANAGHNAPLYLKPGGSQPVRLSASGPPVGLFADAFYDDETITLAPGSALIAFTDGLTEAYATNGEEFGEARLIDVCRRSSGLPAGRLIDAVWTAHEEWTAGVDRADDATMVVLQVLKRQQAAVLRSAFLLEGGAPADAALQEV